MNTKYILYNSKAGGNCQEETEALSLMYEDAVFIDVLKVTDYRVFFAGLDSSDEVIICGGDGTLNRFVNDTRDIDIQNTLYYYAVGSGNDFARDLGKERGAAPTYPINSYIKQLPSVKVKGKETLFVNGVGYGIDGYCCEVGDMLRLKNEKEHKNKPINYTVIAIKGLLFGYNPKNARVTVDGKKYTFKKVWLAPAMFGRYYGGGMMPTPEQDRTGDSLSVMVFHSGGKLRTLTIFPSIFKGGHLKHKKQVTVLSGREITVEFDRPAPLQIDGETVLDVRSYTAKAPLPSAGKGRKKSEKEGNALRQQ